MKVKQAVLYITHKAQYRSYFNKVTKVKDKETFAVTGIVDVPVGFSYFEKEQSQ